MSIFTKINNYFTVKRINRLERDLHMLENRIKFEPKYSKIASSIFTSDKFTRKMTEYFVWYNGDVSVIRDFFMNEGHLSGTGASQEPDSNLFWETAPSDYRFMHAGIPALIASKMATILFGKGFTYDMDVFKDDGTANEAESTAAHKASEPVIDALNLNQLLIKGAASASWGGHVFLKLNYDTALSVHPILEVVDIRNGEEIKKRGITQSFVFHSYFKHKISDSKSIEYRLDEIYRTLTDNDMTRALMEGEKRADGEKGDAVIEYRLYELTEKGDTVEVELNEIDETADIEKPLIVFKGLKGLLAFGVPNRLPNNDFIDSPYGASDYAHSTTAFDALDEVTSELARETRDNKSIRIWPSDMLPKTSTGTLLGPDAYMRNIVSYEKDPSENAKNPIEVQTIADKTESLITKYKQAIASACNNAGISPLALGITGLEAVNSGENSQRERNKATLETRNLKLQIWQPIIEQVIRRALGLDTWMKDNVEGVEREKGTTEVDFTNVRVSIHFPDYIISSDQENITTWGDALMKGVCDTQTAVERVFADYDQDKQREIATLIRFEKGVSTDNPNALSMSELLKENSQNAQPDQTK